MSPLPLTGDVVRAVDALNRRIEAANGMQPLTAPRVVDIGHYGRRGEGDGAETMRHMFGDLIDVQEFLDHFGAAAAQSVVVTIARQELDPLSAIGSVVIQAAALGALMERQRWERKT